MRINSRMIMLYNSLGVLRHGVLFLLASFILKPLNGKHLVTRRLNRNFTWQTPSE